MCTSVKFSERRRKTTKGKKKRRDETGKHEKLQLRSAHAHTLTNHTHLPDTVFPLAHCEGPMPADCCSLIAPSPPSPSSSVSSQRFRKWNLLCKVIASLWFCLSKSILVSISVLSGLFLLLCGYLLVAGIRLKLLPVQICLYQNRKEDNVFLFHPFDARSECNKPLSSTYEWLVPLK